MIVIEDGSTRYGITQTIVVCNVQRLSFNQFDAEDVNNFFYALTKAVDMRLARIDDPIYIWEDHSDDQEQFKKGISANAFIETSNISIHACDPQKTIRITLFTCKSYDPDAAAEFCAKWWKGSLVQSIHHLVF